MIGSDERRRGADAALVVAHGLVTVSHRISTRVQALAVRAARGADRLAGGVAGRRLAALLGRASGTAVVAAQAADDTLTAAADEVVSSVRGEPSTPSVPDPVADDTSQAVVLTHDSSGSAAPSASAHD